MTKKGKKRTPKEKKNWEVTNEKNLTPEEKKRRVAQITVQVRTLGRGGRENSPEYVELCLEGIGLAPSVWTKYRFELFSRYMGSVHARVMELTKQERTMIKTKFIDNESEPMLYRAYACQAMAGYSRMSLGTAVSVDQDYLRKALEFVNRSPPEDNGRVIIDSYDDQDDKTVQDVLAPFRKTCEFNLKAVGGVRCTNEEYAEIQEMENSGSICTKAIKFLNGDETLEKRAIVSGRFCDYCKKSSPAEDHYDFLQMCGGRVIDYKKSPPAEDDNDFLQICSRCKMVFYCSEACQKKSWKEGHKQACRMKGQIEVGDDMLLIGLVSRPELNYSFVKIVGPAEGRENRWLVKLPDREDPISVAGKNLARIRPEHCVV